MTILLVINDFNIVSYIKKHLESGQYHVILCNNSL